MCVVKIIILFLFLFTRKVFSQELTPEELAQFSCNLTLPLSAKQKVDGNIFNCKIIITEALFTDDGSRNVTSELFDKITPRVLLLTNLNLAGCEPGSFDSLTSLSKLSLSNNSLEQVPRFNQLSELLHFDLSNNQIRDLTEFSFENLHHLQIVNLSTNMLASIDPNAFTFPDGQSSLVVLDLGNNLLSDSLSDGFLQTLEQLQDLYLKGNSLSPIDPSFFSAQVNWRAAQGEQVRGSLYLDYTCSCGVLTLVEWMVERWPRDELSSCKEQLSACQQNISFSAQMTPLNEETTSTSASVHLSSTAVPMAFRDYPLPTYQYVVAGAALFFWIMVLLFVTYLIKTFIYNDLEDIQKLL